MSFGAIGSAAAIGGGLYTAFGGGGGGSSVTQVPNMSQDQMFLLNSIVEQARAGNYQAGRPAPPSVFQGPSAAQWQGFDVANRAPGYLGQGVQDIGAGRDTLTGMLDVGQNMQNLQSAFEPIQADIANRFASVDGARSSGFGEALGRGFAQSITPMALGQQSTALSQLPAYAAAPLALGSQAGGELFRAGGLERQIALEGLEDQYRRTEAQQPWMNPWLQMGMGTLGVSPFDSVVSQRFSPAAAASAMLTSPGVLNFLGQGLQGGAPGQAGMASPNQGGLFGSGMRFGF